MSEPMTNPADTIAAEKEAQRRKRIADALAAGLRNAPPRAAKKRAIQRGMFPRFRRSAKGSTR